MSPADLPSQASVIVVGGGVMGCSTLYHLAKFGVTDAVLLERNQVTSGTTWHSAAQVRALRSSRNLTELIRYSIALYSELEAETGQATGWINKGSLSIATTQDRLVHIERQAALAHLFGVEADVIGRGDARERWPLMNGDDVLGAVWSPGDGRVSPSDLCAALVKGAKARGARIFENTGITGILTRDRRIAAVETARGVIQCDALVLCTGLWSREAGLMAHVDLPVWPCEHFYLLTKPVPGAEGNLPTLSDHDGHLYIRDDSGGLLVGCFEPMGKPIDPDRIGPDFAFQLLPEDWDHFEPMMTNALHRLPVLEQAEVKMLLNGPESFTPDGSFVLGEAPLVPGLYLGCGMNSVGVATGGGAGMALARTIVDGQAPFDLGEAHPARFPPEVFTTEALTARAPEVLGKHYEITYPGRHWSTARDLRAHPLADQFRRSGAVFGQVYGWERPVVFGDAPHAPLAFGRPPWFDQVAAEVEAAHNRAALFDLSTFGTLDVEGPDACRLLDRVCANRMDRGPGRAIYTQMLNARGGIESDLTAVRISDTHYRLSVGTSAVLRDIAWLNRHAADFDVTIRDRTAEVSTIGLMGPDSAAILERLGATDLVALRYFQSVDDLVDGVAVRGTRLSFVGELGWELSCAVPAAGQLWDMLRGQGAEPAGLYAQTSMRIEKRFLSHGHDMDTDTTPLDVGLGFAVGWDTDFIGREALVRRQENGAANRLMSVLFDDSAACPIGDEPVLLDGKIIGKTTSAAFGHRVGRPVALVMFADGQVPSAGTVVETQIAAQRFSGTVNDGAVFDPSGARMKDH
ncbi:MAG: FAD-dependent oxidoreductase [Paracoccaceae bacterium]